MQSVNYVDQCDCCLLEISSKQQGLGQPLNERGGGRVGARVCRSKTSFENFSKHNAHSMMSVFVLRQRIVDYDVLRVIVVMQYV